MKKNAAHILDVTIRDGSYLINHQFSLEQVAKIAKALSESGVEYAEISHGYGIGGKMMGYPGLADDDELMEAARQAAPKLKIVAFISSVPQSLPLIPGVIEYIDLARVALNLDKPEDSEKLINKLKKYHKKVAVQLTRAHRRPPEIVAKIARKAQNMGADLIYLVDTFGSMVSQDVETYLDAIKSQVQTTLGFHGHNNRGLAISNTLTAYHCGASWLDASLLGVGRGAGNANLEALVSLLHAQKQCEKIQLEELTRITQQIIFPLFGAVPYSNLMDILLAEEKLDYSTPTHLELFSGLSGISPQTYLSELHRKVGRALELQDQHIEALFQDLGMNFSKIKKKLFG